MWWQADKPAGNFYEVVIKSMQGFFRVDFRGKVVKFRDFELVRDGVNFSVC